MKTRITSTVIISIFVLINGFFTLYLLLPIDLNNLISDSAGSMPEVENAGMIMMMPLLLLGAMVVFFFCWMLAISVTHAICLIFTIKNRKSPIKAVRIINYVLDAANIFLIATPIIKFIMFRLSH